MDVRKPHAAHSLREFAVEIGTITIGILIALSLEALVEAMRDHELVDTARSQLISELRFNRQNLADVVATAKTNRATLTALVHYGQARLAHQSETLPKGLNLTGSFTTLRTSGWESTVATQAIAHMPMAEAQAVAGVYASSRGYNDLEAKAEDHWFELAAFGSDVDQMSDAEVKVALAHLRVVLNYQIATADSGERLLADYDHALAVLKAAS